MSQRVKYDIDSAMQVQGLNFPSLNPRERACPCPALDWRRLEDSRNDMIGSADEAGDAQGNDGWSQNSQQTTEMPLKFADPCAV